MAEEQPIPRLRLHEYDKKLLKKLCRLQDEYLEQIPKQLHNRTLGMALEENMDILRELSCRKFPDPGYITEKSCMMIQDLIELNMLNIKLPKECKRTF